MTDSTVKARGLSAVLCIRNEEAQLADCLARLGFASEIVVVLDRSTDGSREIAERFGAHVVAGSFEREGPRRHAGIDAASGPWILEVDADERVPPALADEIVRTAASSTSARHLIPVDNYIGKHLVRYGWGGAFGKGAYAGLFRKGTKHWGDQRVHPRVSFDGEAGDRLTQPLEHYVDRSISDMVARLNRYTSLRAQDLRDHWRETGAVDETLGRNLRRIVGRFYKCYWRRRGYREGKWGVLIAMMAALYPILSYLKAVLEDE
ncbi:MAG TPA: glycosyltransferase family 2 protein [Alphaproteobacteria bacterium]|nr:glycosyltransferase family 2 protein [Alphaproteobacteria bacterium]